jgi:rod shape-determining protein MreD
MAISKNKESTIGVTSIIPFLTILFLIIIMMLPYKIAMIGDIMPFLTLIGVYYWSVFRARRLPIWIVFILGVLQDILLGSPIGMMALFCCCKNSRYVQ